MTYASYWLAFINSLLILKTILLTGEISQNFELSVSHLKPSNLFFYLKWISNEFSFAEKKKKKSYDNVFGGF